MFSAPLQVQACIGGSDQIFVGFSFGGFAMADRDQKREEQAIRPTLNAKPTLRKAERSEFRKLEKPVNEAEFRKSHQ